MKSASYTHAGNEIAKEEGGSLSLCEKIKVLFDDGEYGRPFKGLETHYQQMKYIKTHFQYIVSIIYIWMHACTRYIY